MSSQLGRASEVRDGGRGQRTGQVPTGAGEHRGAARAAGRSGEAYLALWWVETGSVPTVEEAKRRLERIRRRGPSPDAFTLREPFPAPAPDGRPERAGVARSLTRD